MEQPIHYRRNVQALSKEDRKQYFWCLKMLGILPPFQAMKERYFWTLGTPGPEYLAREDSDYEEKKDDLPVPNSPPYNQIQPKCLHD